MDFKIDVPAKCILAGEHTILHSGFAIVSPFKSYTLSLSYAYSDIKTAKTITGEFASTPIYLWMAISKACELAGKDARELNGQFNLKSNILVGAGLGFSAALCVAVAKWAVYFGMINDTETFEFAVKLEDIFHGKSSGVDIAGVLSKQIIQYTNTREIHPISPTWHPKLYISSSGEYSITERCVALVNKFRQEHPTEASAVDTKMINASKQILHALQKNDNESFELLAYGLNEGNECFYKWGLVSEKLNAHIQQVKQYAYACKIIGAGYGGHIISLWKDEPPKNLPFKLVKLAG